MDTQSTFRALRGRLNLQIERNHWLEQKNKQLLQQVADLERERRRVDSGLVRLIRVLERFFSWK